MNVLGNAFFYQRDWQVCILRLKLHWQIVSFYWVYFHKTLKMLVHVLFCWLHIYSWYRVAPQKTNLFTFIKWGLMYTDIFTKLSHVLKMYIKKNKLCSLLFFHAGLGSAWGPVEFGYSVACAQCWGDLLFFLFTGSDPPAWTSAPSEICTGRTGHEQVRRRNMSVHLFSP